MELEVGKLYLARGLGVAKLVDVDDRIYPTMTVLLAHGNAQFTVFADDLIREAGMDDVLAYNREALPRNVDCRDASCWCAEMRKGYHQ